MIVKGKVNVFDNIREKIIILLLKMMGYYLIKFVSFFLFIGIKLYVFF